MGASTGVKGWMAVTCALLSGCTVVNDIDVCDREAAPDREVNVRTEGSQIVHGDGAVADLPGDGALLAFLTSPVGDRTERRGIRVTLLTADGGPIRTCDAPGGAFDVVSLEEHGDMLRSRPFLVADDNLEGTHLLLWSETSGFPTPGELRAVSLFSTGCVDDDPFTLSDSPEWIPLVGQAANTRSREFTVVWTEAFPNDDGLITMTRAMARTLSVHGSVEFLGNVGSLEGDPIQIAELASPGRIAMTRLDDGRLAVAALDGVRSWNVRAVIIDDRLEVHESHDVALGERIEVPSQSVDVVWNGTRLLVLWTEPDATERLVARARWLDPDAGPVGPPFEIGPGPGDQLELSGVPMADGRVLATWHRTAGVDGAEVEAEIVTADGSTQFANPACGRGDFRVNTTTGADQHHPAAASLDDGRVLIVYSDESNEGADRSEAGVRARSFEPNTLLPVE